MNYSASNLAMSSIRPLTAAAMEPPIAPNGPIRDALDYRSRFPDGRIGSDSSLATVEQGREIIAAAVKGLIDDIAKFDAE